MKRLATGILTGAMALSLSAATASATEHNVEEHTFPRTQMTKTFSREGVSEELISLRGETISREGISEKLLAQRGESASRSEKCTMIEGNFSY